MLPSHIAKGIGVFAPVQLQVANALQSLSSIQMPRAPQITMDREMILLEVTEGLLEPALSPTSLTNVDASSRL